VIVSSHQVRQKVTVTGVVTAQPGQVWKVGQLAKLTGLTVRALHYYDHLGLVMPSARTAAGYRLYGEAGVERLYQVLALRQLGLPLDAVGAVLDGQSSIGELLERHRAHLDRQLVAMRTLRAQLSTMTTVSQGAGSGSVTDFLDLIRKVITVDGTVKKYFSEEQLADLAAPRTGRRAGHHRCAGGVAQADRAGAGSRGYRSGPGHTAGAGAGGRVDGSA